jgi:hypothetical protein
MKAARRLSLALAALAVLACSGKPAGVPAKWDAGFRGPGRLVLLFEPGDPDVPRVLVVHDRDGARALPVERPRAARWLSGHELIVSQEIPPPKDDEYGLPSTQLLRVDVETGAVKPWSRPARWFDAEPDPRGERLVAGLEIDDQGASELVVLGMASQGDAPLVEVERALDRPRWSPDGSDLVVLQTINDPEGEATESGVSFGGQEVAFPRLFRVSSDLTGTLALLRDGEEPKAPLAAGGSLPLWWGPKGIYAKQRRGLVLCDPASGGCKSVFAPGGDRRVVDGRPLGADRALLLVRDHSPAQAEVDLPRELVELDLNSGASRVIYTAAGDVYISEIDWVEGP